MQKKASKGKWYGIVLVVVVIALFALLQTQVNFSNIADIDYLKEKILSFGILSPAVFILIMATAVVISPIPSLPLDVAAGIIWGPYFGTLFAVIGAEIGAIISFLLARYFGRALVEKLFQKQIIFCDECNERTLFILVFFSRLFPFFQFDIISYGAGLTNMKLRSFAIATFFGMIPMTYIFTNFGTGFSLGNYSVIILSVILIALMFTVPWLINKYNVFNLKDKINIK